MKHNVNKDKIEFIAWLRIPAVFFVVYDHLGPFWSSTASIKWSVSVFINKYICNPLAISEFFGFFGVVLFFLISGYIITHVVQRESPVEFIIKRFFRIYPPLIFSFFLIFLVSYILKHLANYASYWESFHFIDFVLSGTLLNYAFDKPNLINGVTWSLFVECLFYIMIFLFYSMYKTSRKYAAYFQILTFIIVVNVIIKINCMAYLSLSVYYISYLIFCQLIYFLLTKKISTLGFILLTLINYLVLVQNTIQLYPEHYSANNSYLISFVYAYCVFIIALLANKHIKMSKISLFLSNLSYSIYLNHFTIGALVLSLIVNKVNYTFAFFAAVIVTICISFISYNLIENPFIKLSKKIIANLGVRNE